MGKWASAAREKVQCRDALTCRSICRCSVWPLGQGRLVLGEIGESGAGAGGGRANELVVMFLSTLCHDKHQQ
jgi:hypothetical protein